MAAWMIPPGVPPHGWGHLLRVIAAWIGALVDDVRRGARGLGAGVRHRWSPVRDHLSATMGRTRSRARRAAWRAGDRARSLTLRTDAWLRRRGITFGGLKRAVAWTRHALRRGRSRVGRSFRAVAARFGPAVGRLRAVAGRFMEWARRHAPGPRTAAALGVIAIIAGWVLWERCGVAGCPDVDRLTSYQPEGATVLVDRSGERFADLAPVEHTIVHLDSLPGYVPAAFIAVEDRRFYQHRGVDWPRVLGAFWADLKAGGLVEGSSTIPMQLSRNLYPDRIRAREKTFRRKLLEMRMAGEIEERFSKREILELYLNHIYFGGGAHGIEAAARYYFDRGAAELELHQAATLAALPKAPADYDPRRKPDAARARRDLVLALMEEQDLVSVAESSAARERELDAIEDARRDPDGDVFAPYFVRQVRRQLEDRLGEALYARPLRVVTTLDPAAQMAAEAELERQLERVEQGWYGRFRGTPYARIGTPGAPATEYLQGAVVVMGARTGDVLAWVGGRDFDQSRYDRALLARRQAGSAFKPFVYAAALERGLSPSQPILDAPYRRDTGSRTPWEPRNYSGQFEGRMSMRDALVRSQNVPAIRLAAATGDSAVADLARRVGIRGEVPASPVNALGVTVVSPVEMTSAYSAFAGRGTRVDPRFVLRVEDPEGNVIWAPEPVRTPALDSDVAWLLTDMLRDVVDYGTGAVVRRVGYRGAAAGKTGTTSDATDVWFVGYNPDVVGTVWVGFDEVRPLPSGATGGGVAAPVWGRMMAQVRDGGGPSWWPRPAGIIARRVDPETGRSLREGCYPRYEQPRTELFLESRTPASICPRRHYRRFRDRLARWLDDTFGSRHAGAWAQSDADPDLGYPRIPLRGEVEEPAEYDEYDDDRWDRRDRRDRDRRGSRWDH